MYVCTYSGNHVYMYACIIICNVCTHAVHAYACFDLCMYVWLFYVCEQCGALTSFIIYVYTYTCKQEDAY